MHRDLERALLVQCTAHQADAAARLGLGGLVITGQRAAEKAQNLRERGFDRPVLCDAQRYTGRRRKSAREAFDKRWMGWHLDRGHPALTDSGYVDKLDVRGLTTVLHRTMRLGGTSIATLPLHADWLKVPQDREILLTEVTFAEVPIAIAVEHAADPLGVREVLRGLLSLIATGVPVILLRSDVSALGALCHGALAAAVGTSTSLRHISPVTAGGGGRRASVAVLAPHFLSYVTADKLAAAVQLTPDLENLWACECTTCNGRTMDWIATLRSGQESTAFRHSLEHLGLLRDQLFAADLPADELKRAWYERCSFAAALHLELRTELPDWRTPSFLNAWRNVWAPSPERAVHE